MHLSVRQLRLLAAVAEHQTLTKAAASLAISQSAASQAIHELEHQLGQKVARKQGRVLQLTPYGQQIVPKVRNILAEIDSLPHGGQQFVGGGLRLAASETIGSYLLPKCLAQSLSDYPTLQPSLAILNTEQVVTALRHGEAELGFVEGPVHDAAVTIEPWYQDELVVFCRPDLASLVRQKPMDEWPWIVREPGSGTRAVFDQSCHANQLHPNIQLQLSRQDAIKQAVKAGLGVGCLSGLAVADELAERSVQKLPVSLGFERQFSFVKRADEPLSANAEAFKQLVKKATRQ